MVSTSEANLVLPVLHWAHFFFGSAAARRSAPRARPESWPSVGGQGQQRGARPPAGAGSDERARAACMGLREAAVGALRPSGSAGSTGGRRAGWTWTRSGAGGRVAGSSSSLVTARCRRCSVTAGSSSSVAVVEAAARSRRSSAPQQTQDGMPSKASSLCRVREVLHHSARLTRTLSALKTIALSECEDHHWNRTKRDSCSGTKTGPI